MTSCGTSTTSSIWSARSHVGLGSDFDGISSTPEGAEDVSRLPAVTEALAARGYGDDDDPRDSWRQFPSRLSANFAAGRLSPATDSHTTRE